MRQWLWLIAALVSGLLHLMFGIWILPNASDKQLSLPVIGGGVILQLSEASITEEQQTLIEQPEPESEPEPEPEPKPEPEPEPEPESEPEPEPEPRPKPKPKPEPEPEPAVQKFSNPDEADEISEIRQQESTEAAVVGQPLELDFPGGNPQAIIDYQTELQLWLQRYKTYPRRLKRRRIEGDVVVSFTINSQGHLLAYSLINSSGVPELDKAAMQLLEASEPLPSIPAELGISQYTVQVPIRYTLR
ncbi:MAG: protein TonB [Granulosicoccus sp.]|jgi:protein TonB